MDNEKKIWDVLLKFIGNPYGVAGQMGNLQAESGFNPKKLENSFEKKLGMTDAQYTQAIDDGTYTREQFANDGAGYGLAQWTYHEHKDLMYFGAKYRNVSIGDLDYQLEFLQEDLNRFSSVLNVLRTATSVKEASDDVLLRYEKPADTSEAVKNKRIANAQVFFDAYADKDWVLRNKKANEVVASARSRIGDPYVFGARGETCTPSSRRSYADNDNCPVIHNGKSSCSGCKYKGRHIYDCRGFTYRCFLDAGMRIDGAGATSQFNDSSNWMETGLTDDMPDVVCCLFKKKGDKMSHTGIHIGNGQIIHCSGEVKTDVISNRTWTHYAIPIGLYTKKDVASARRIKAVSNLKKGSKGAAVEELQRRLKELGYYTGAIDGIFGTGTVKAVKEFQADHALTVDGIAGTLTQTVLDEAYKGKDAISSGDQTDGTDVLTDLFSKIGKYIVYINKYAKKIDTTTQPKEDIYPTIKKYVNYITKYAKKITDLTTIKGV